MKNEIVISQPALKQAFTSLIPIGQENDVSVIIEGIKINIHSGSTVADLCKEFDEALKQNQKIARSQLFEKFISSLCDVDSMWVNSISLCANLTIPGLNLTTDLDKFVGIETVSQEKGATQWIAACLEKYLQGNELTLDEGGRVFHILQRFGYEAGKNLIIGKVRILISMKSINIDMN